ncbi:MAG: response regulator [Nitrososphaerota archaeon]|nr:response regulator [Nitrososphaerota archaeon]
MIKSLQLIFYDENAWRGVGVLGVVLITSIDRTGLLTIEAKYVLVIDDDQSILRTMVRVLEKNGFSADTAKTAKEAIEKSKMRQYDAALIDLRLPDMTGLEVLAHADLGGAIKIMLTGFPSLVTGIKAREYGADAYLRKPVHPEELLKLIRVKLTQRK